MSSLVGGTFVDLTMGTSTTKHLSFLNLILAIFSIIVGLLAVGLFYLFSTAKGSETTPQQIRALLDDGYFVSEQILKGPTRSNESGRDGKSDPVHLSVIIPAFNEEERLPIMLQETLSYFNTRKRKERFEIILVDDCSTDSTPNLAQEKYGGLNKTLGGTTIYDFRVIRLKKNQGKGFAVKVGMLSAVGLRRLMVDADGATRFSDLEQLEAALEESDDESGSRGATTYDIAFGSRNHLIEGVSAKRAWYRNILMYGLHLLVRILITGRHQIIHDTQCGFKLFSAKAASILFRNLHIRRWAFDLELVVLASLHGFHITEVPVNWQEIPGSKLSIVSATLSMLKDMFQIRLSYMLGIWKIVEAGE